VAISTEIKSEKKDNSKAEEKPEEKKEIITEKTDVPLYAAKHTIASS
jgi:hypothetical protein